MKTLQEINEFVAWYKRTSPCTDCGLNFPSECMDFDHVPERGMKVGSIQSFIRSYDLDSLFKEIAKCDVVCACCHRIRTRKRGPSAQALQNLGLSQRGKPKKHGQMVAAHRASRKAICLDGRIFPSMSDAASELGVGNSTVTRMLQVGRAKLCQSQ